MKYCSNTRPHLEQGACVQLMLLQVNPKGIQEVRESNHINGVGASLKATLIHNDYNL
jgi:hypothetical protein